MRDYLLIIVWILLFLVLGILGYLYLKIEFILNQQKPTYKPPKTDFKAKHPVILNDDAKAAKKEQEEQFFDHGD